jgi:hypothetical protein
MSLPGTFESFGASCQDDLSDRYRGYSGQDGMISSLAATDALRPLAHALVTPRFRLSLRPFPPLAVTQPEVAAASLAAS